MDRHAASARLAMMKKSVCLDSSFAKRDSACGLESRISSARSLDRPLVLSHSLALKNHDSSSTILESQSKNLRVLGEENKQMKNPPHP